MNKKHDHERGVALIAVLCLIFTAGLLVGALVMIAQIHTVNIGATTAVARSKYIAEGSLNRIQYLIEADRELFESVNNTETNYGEYDHDRFLPDSVDREINYYGTIVKYRIVNGASGLQMAQNRYRQSLNMLRSTLTGADTVNDKITILGNRIADYVDSDDNTGTDGMEKGDYEELEMNNLPRNAQFQFREELRWIPEINDILPVDKNGRFSLVRLPSISENIRPDLYTASWAQLRIYGGLDEKQAAEVMNALTIWRREKTPLGDLIDPLLLGTVLNRFSIAPSNYYSIIIERAIDGDRPTSRLVATFRTAGAAGPNDGIIRYLEWLRF